MLQTTIQGRYQFRFHEPSKAPKARSIPTWGAAQGTGAQKNRGLKARPNRLSIPQIPLIETYPIFLEKSAKFILKRLLPVVDFLGIDVLDQRTQISRPDRERTITSLPREFRQIRRLSLEPLGRGRLELFHRLRDILCARQANREMNVVRDSAHTKAFAFAVASDSSKVRIECRANRRIEEGSTVLCAEDHMDHNKRERLWHHVDYRSGFQP